MSFETARRAAVFASSVGLSENFALLWHAGEPLTVPPDWYAEAHDHIFGVLKGVPRRIGFQTNGTLLSPRWVEFFERYPEIYLGISIDGPAFLHDAHRRTRASQPTHARVVRGIQRLKDAGIPFSCIAVATEDTLSYPDEFYDFFVDLQPKLLGINSEELEGPNTTSSLFSSDMEAKYRSFMQRIAQRALTEGNLAVREFNSLDKMLAVVREGDELVDCRNILNVPWRMISVDWSGDISTYSPELLGVDIRGSGSSLGNVHIDHSFESIVESEKFQNLNEEINAGVLRCRQSCDYYSVCGGGAPSNKWFEKGTFDIAETQHCRIAIQATTEAYFKALELTRS